MSGGEHERSLVRTEIAVVGAGPAGLAAAVAAAERGKRVVVIDSGTQPGGQFWRHPDESAHPGYAGAGQHAWRSYVDLRARFDGARARGDVAYWPNRQVWTLGCHEEGFEVRTVADTGPASAGTELLVAERVVLCTGAYDRQLPVPGWDLPGVLSAGGVQAFIKANGFAPGRRVVIAGTGPFLLPVADSVARTQATVVAVCEAASPTRWVRRIAPAVRVPAKLAEAARYAATFVRHRIPWHTRTVVTEVLGTDRVNGVRLAKVDRDGRVLRHRTVHDVDAVGFGWGFTPQLELAVALGARTRIDIDGSVVAAVDEQQRCDVPGLFLAGEVTGVGGAQLAVAEGAVAGAAAAGQNAVAAAQARTIRAHRAFAAVMHEAHPVPAAWESWLAADTLVCRCEEVPYSEVRDARVDLGATDTRGVKSFTRVGMGWCQGRICGFAVGCLATDTTGESAARAAESALKRPLAAPVSLGDLADLPVSDDRDRLAKEDPDMIEAGKAVTTDTETVESAVAAAQRAAGGWALTSPTERAQALAAIADVLEENRAELVELADTETSLGDGRLNGELTRTVFQLRQFADVASAGEFFDVRIDRADQGWPSGPRPDLRRFRVPLGPVQVFAASNFPFAFSVMGGDTASALAAGCPVVVKAHPGHPALSRRTAHLVREALDFPGVFALIEGEQAGIDALRHEGVRAAAFTGSVAGGLALARIAAERAEPIPFFGEMGSINPVVVTPAAARERGDEIAQGYIASLTQGAGQFCTNPGLLFVPEDGDLVDRAAALLREVAVAPMLNDRIASGFLGAAARLGDLPGLRRVVWPEEDDSLAPRLAVTDLSTFAAAPAAAEECFGPFGLVVTYRDPTELAAVLRSLPGQLTTTMHAEEHEAAALRELVASCVDRSGRVLWNGWPTGVAVTAAMQHGGPFPASTTPATTSVGTAAVERFVRPVSYQNWPQALLPEPLRDDNPWSVPQKIS